mmetsp:Transcript_22144/g.56106  ORF Transcript_22144/g.56106 Transcript_22144/m.56106 type:complete len:281 (+) Transcript_22144:63-905(+)
MCVAVCGSTDDQCVSKTYVLSHAARRVQQSLYPLPQLTTLHLDDWLDTRVGQVECRRAGILLQRAEQGQQFVPVHQPVFLPPKEGVQARLEHERDRDHAPDGVRALCLEVEALPEQHHTFGSRRRGEELPVGTLLALYDQPLLINACACDARHPQFHVAHRRLGVYAYGVRHPQAHDVEQSVAVRVLLLVVHHALGRPRAPGGLGGGRSSCRRRGRLAGSRRRPLEARGEEEHDFGPVGEPGVREQLIVLALPPLKDEALLRRGGAGQRLELRLGVAHGR